MALDLFVYFYFFFFFLKYSRETGRDGQKPKNNKNLPLKFFRENDLKYLF